MAFTSKEGSTKQEDLAGLEEVDDDDDDVNEKSRLSKIGSLKKKVKETVSDCHTTPTGSDEWKEVG